MPVVPSASKQKSFPEVPVRHHTQKHFRVEEKENKLWSRPKWRYLRDTRVSSLLATAAANIGKPRLPFRAAHDIINTEKDTSSWHQRWKQSGKGGGGQLTSNRLCGTRPLSFSKCNLLLDEFVGGDKTASTFFFIDRYELIFLWMMIMWHIFSVFFPFLLSKWQVIFSVFALFFFFWSSCCFFFFLLFLLFFFSSNCLVPFHFFTSLSSKNNVPLQSTIQIARLQRQVSQFGKNHFANCFRLFWFLDLKKVSRIYHCVCPLCKDTTWCINSDLWYTKPKGLAHDTKKNFVLNCMFRATSIVTEKWNTVFSDGHATVPKHWRSNKQG